MVQGRSYPKGWQDRVGQVNYRQDTPDPTFTGTQHRTTERKHPRGSRFTTQPDSYIIATKKKGFGSLGTNESDLLPIVAASRILGSLTVNTHHRYKVNIYCK